MTFFYYEVTELMMLMYIQNVLVHERWGDESTRQIVENNNEKVIQNETLSFWENNGSHLGIPVEYSLMQENKLKVRKNIKQIKCRKNKAKQTNIRSQYSVI